MEKTGRVQSPRLKTSKKGSASSEEKPGNPAFTFKTSDHNFDMLGDQAGFRPAPYLASRGMKWIQQYNDDPSKDDELKYYIKESYRIVSLGLTKKKQKELGLNQD